MNEENKKAMEAIQERFKSLPKELQDAITSSKYQETLFEIAKKHNLSLSETSELEVNTTMVMLGLLRPEDYADELSVDIKRPDKDIQAIVTDVNEQVIKNVRGRLMAMQEGSEQPSPAVSPAEAGEQILRDSGIQIEKAEQPESIVTPPNQADDSVLKNSGIELEDQPAAASAPTDQPESRNDALKSIENPPSSNPAGMVSQKLSGSFSVPRKESDHTLEPLSKEGGQAAGPKRPADPYREPIE